MKTAAFVLVLLLLVGTAAGQGVELELKLYDVSTITEKRVHTHGVFLGHRSSGGFGFGFGEEIEKPAPGGFLEVDAIADIIRETVEPASWDSGGDVMGMEGGILAVKNRPAVHAMVRKMIADLAAAASQRIGFSVEVYELGSDKYPDHLPDPKLEALKVAGVLIGSASGEAWPGISTAVQVTNRVRFVRDYDVEIAQGSNISDPIVDFGLEGIVLELLARPTLDGNRLLIDAIVQQGRFDRPFREVELGIDEEYFAEPYRSEVSKNLGIIEMPVFHHSGVALTRMVPAGGTFTIPIISEGRTLLFLVKTKLLGSKQPENILQTGALCYRPRDAFFGEHPERDYADRARMAPMLRRSARALPRLFPGPEELFDFVVQNVAPWYWEEEGAWMNITERQDIFIKASDDILKAVREFIVKLETEQLRQIYFDLRVYSSKATINLGPQDAFPEGTPVYAASVSALPGRRVSLQTGNTMNYLADYDVEVAQEARISDPIIGQSFEGLLADLKPRFTPDGESVVTKLHLLLSHRQHGNPYDSGTRFLGPVDRIEENRSVIDLTVTIPVGKVFLLDAGVNPRKKGERLLVAVKASRR